MLAVMSRLRTLLGLGWKTRLVRPLDELWDRRLGVRTAGWQPAIGTYDDPAWQVEYKPTAYTVLARLFRRVGLGPHDVFVDLGCGLGRAVFLARWFGARRAVGVEIDAGLVARANDNLRGCRLPRSGIEFVAAPAESYPLDECTVLFMFNPFGRGTMAKVVEGLTASLARRPRPLRVAYLNPLFDATLDASPALLRVDHWDDGPKSEGLFARFRRAGGWSATFFAARGGAEM